MNTDKIKTIITPVVFNHIADLNADQLVNMRINLLQDMPLHKAGTPLHFARSIELQFIDQRLERSQN